MEFPHLLFQRPTNHAQARGLNRRLFEVLMTRLLLLRPDQLNIDLHHQALTDQNEKEPIHRSSDIKEEIVGLAEVKDVFKSSAMGAVAGCQVIEGSVKKGNPIRILRDNVVIYEGELESLRRHKDDVKEVKLGTECGIAVKNYNDVKPGDNIEVFTRTEFARTL